MRTDELTDSQSVEIIRGRRSGSILESPGLDRRPDLGPGDQALRPPNPLQPGPVGGEIDDLRGARFQGTGAVHQKKRNAK